MLMYYPQLTCFFLDQVKDEIYLYNFAGERITRLAEDFVGAASLSGRRSHQWFFTTLIGFTTPGIVAQYDFREPEDKKWSIYRKTLVKGLNPDDFLADQVNMVWKITRAVSFPLTLFA